MLTTDIDVDRSIVTFRGEDDKTELTVSTAPLSTVEATPAAHLIPSPGVSAETALKQTAEIITSLTDSNGYIHIDFSDVISICASAAIRIIRFNAGDDPSKAFSDVLAAQGIDPSCCDGALINIGAPANIGLAEATSLATIVQEAIQIVTGKQSLHWHACLCRHDSSASFDRGLVRAEKTGRRTSRGGMSSDNTSRPSSTLLPVMASFPKASPLARRSYSTHPIGIYRPWPRTLERTSVKSIARAITSWTVKAPFRVPIPSCFIATMASPFVSTRVLSSFDYILSCMHIIFYIRTLDMGKRSS
ncbi:hypothetical protein [Bifidobacterium moukalabense]|uniref:Cell division protein ftsZ n=1 Tax=Bifidobacterium moukalabense DSM 27321 TaxID=1435051 RepID=W4NBP9_9BIFI|nr:hypothetical protein [Bifidobacterium moukalabense]ETY72105.1 cell division protein ftsZ [Bifidobacterium moukalabense DSM 27321]